MSTRCQIEFKHITKYAHRKKPIIERRTVYRHSDGYPNEEYGVIESLKKFLKWNNGRNDDIEYQVANFIYWSKRWSEERYFNKSGFGKIEDRKLKWNDNLPTNCSILHIGFGICVNDGFHGDIEYFYEVVRNTIEKSKGKYKTTTKILVYKVVQKDYSKPVKRENLKLIKTIRLNKDLDRG